MRLNIGSGNVPLDGYTSVDLVEPAEIVGDFLEMEFESIEQVNMSHVLEHISFRRTREALERVHSWMAPGGLLRVEVPDCAELVLMDVADGNWQQWMFGSQGGPGQYHCAGFTAETLRVALEAAGWSVLSMRRFGSINVNRVGYPCIEATASA